MMDEAFKGEENARRHLTSLPPSSPEGKALTAYFSKSKGTINITRRPVWALLRDFLRVKEPDGLEDRLAQAASLYLELGAQPSELQGTFSRWSGDYDRYQGNYTKVKVMEK